jgi:hypothetical protein
MVKLIIGTHSAVVVPRKAQDSIRAFEGTEALDWPDPLKLVHS